MDLRLKNLSSGKRTALKEKCNLKGYFLTTTKTFNDETIFQYKIIAVKYSVQQASKI